MIPAYVYYGRSRHIQELRDILKEQTLEQRRKKNLGLRPMQDPDIRPAMLRESIS